MKDKIISIIVPVYNTKEYLVRCVNSLKAQTYPGLEIILVDDGSTDGSGEMCDELAVSDDRIKALHKENGGSSSARNLGISQAKGEYIGFVDSDDYVDTDMYEKLADAMEHFGVNAAQIGRDEISPNGSILPDICIPPEEPECIPPEKFMEELLMHRGDCSFCTKLLRKTVLEEWRTGAEEEAAAAMEAAAVGEWFPPGVLNEDFHLLIQLLDRIGPIASLPGHAYHVFYRENSNSRKTDRESFSRVYLDNVDNADMAAGIVKEKYPGLEDIVFRFGIFQRLDYMLHIPISQMTKDNYRYRGVVIYLRKNWVRSMKNPILTKKNKIYHTLFAVSPRGVRRLHRRLRGQR